MAELLAIAQLAMLGVMIRVYLTDAHTVNRVITRDASSRTGRRCHGGPSR